MAEALEQRVALKNALPDEEQISMKKGEINSPFSGIQRAAGLVMLVAVAIGFRMLSG
jgi:hypothetical protein